MPYDSFGRPGRIRCRSGPCQKVGRMSWIGGSTGNGPRAAPDTAAPKAGMPMSITGSALPKEVSIMDVSIAHNPSSVQYLIQGTKQEVLNEIQRLETRYHPVGYGTRVKSSNLSEDLERYTALVERYASCD